MQKLHDSIWHNDCYSYLSPSMKPSSTLGFCLRKVPEITENYALLGYFFYTKAVLWYNENLSRKKEGLRSP